MSFFDRNLFVIICESILEHKIVNILKKAGVRGYTILEARGDGNRGQRSGDFEYNKNIQIEVICRDETGEKFCEEMRERFFKDYAMVIYKSPVGVMRSEKFN